MQKCLFTTSGAGQQESLSPPAPSFTTVDTAVGSYTRERKTLFRGMGDEKLGKSRILNCKKHFLLAYFFFFSPICSRRESSPSQTVFHCHNRTLTQKLQR